MTPNVIAYILMAVCILFVIVMTYHIAYAKGAFDVQRRFLEFWAKRNKEVGMTEAGLSIIDMHERIGELRAFNSAAEDLQDFISKKLHIK